MLTIPNVTYDMALEIEVVVFMGDVPPRWLRGTAVVSVVPN